MTANQISYAKYLEDRRSHLASESIEGRKATASEISAMASAEQAETARINASTNILNAEAAQTSAAAQWKNAQTSAAAQTEAVRHNQRQEELDRLKADLNYSASVYASDSSRLSSMYASDTSKENAQLSAETQKLNTELSTRANIIGGLITSVSRLISAGGK